MPCRSTIEWLCIEVCGSYTAEQKPLKPTMKRMQSRKPIELSVKHFLTDREADGFLVSSLAVHRMLDLADAGYMDKEITHLGTDREGVWYSFNRTGLDWLGGQLGIYIFKEE